MNHCIVEFFHSQSANRKKSDSERCNHANRVALSE
jgi:hypothetical protein